MSANTDTTQNATHKIFTIPNILTMARLAMIVLMVALFRARAVYWALGVYLLAMATDVVDGHIARRLNQISNFGKVLDPVADKLMYIAVLYCLYMAGFILPLALWLIVIKESIMILGGVVVYLCVGKVVTSNLFGKAAALAYFSAILLTFLHTHIAPWDAVALYAAIAINYVALIQYAYLNVFLEIKKRRHTPVAGKENLS